MTRLSSGVLCAHGFSVPKGSLECSRAFVSGSPEVFAVNGGWFRIGSVEGSPKYSLHLSQKWQLSLAIYMFVITIIRKSVVKGKLKIRCRDYPCPSFEQNRVVSPLSYCRKGNESWTLLLKKPCWFVVTVQSRVPILVSCSLLWNRQMW